MAYLDAAAGLPLHPAARAALLTAIDDGWADPLRLYREGRRARILLDEARESIAGIIGVRPDELSFTSSGTQACQLAVLGALTARRRAGRHLLASAVEHSSVLLAAQAHERDGGTVTLAAVDRGGRISPQTMAAAIREDTALVCLQTANHEVGTVQPVAEVAEICRERGVPLFTDAAQSVGRTPVDLAGLGAAYAAASAHKWGGPPGVGLLVVRTGFRWRAPVPADDRESGRVPGFGNLPGVLGAAAALRARTEEMAGEARRLAPLVDRIRGEVPQRVADTEVLGDPVHRLPHVVTFSCLYVDGEALLHELDRAGFSVGSGSSCTASTLEPSHVLAAMGVLTHGNVRVSLPGSVTDQDIDGFIVAVAEIVPRLRDRLGASDL